VATGFINRTQCTNLIFLLIAFQQSNWTYSPEQGQRTRSVICLANTIIRSSECRFGNRVPWLRLALRKNRPCSWSTSWKRAPRGPPQGTTPFISAQPRSKHARCAERDSSLRKFASEGCSGPCSAVRGVPCSPRPRRAAGYLDHRAEERLQCLKLSARYSHCSARALSLALLIKPAPNFGVVFNCFECFCRPCCINRKKESFCTFSLAA